MGLIWFSMNSVVELAFRIHWLAATQDGLSNKQISKETARGGAFVSARDLSGR